MTIDRPKYPIEYRNRLAEFSMKDLSVEEARYIDLSDRTLRFIRASEFWTRLHDHLERWARLYAATHRRHPLWGTASPPELTNKQFERFLQKTYRINVLTNDNWPEPPSAGWVTPANWWTSIRDIIRARIVVRFLDGVPFLIEQLEGLIDRCGLSEHMMTSYKATGEGYYAAQIAFRHPTAPVWHDDPHDIYVELQIRTQLQEAIEKLTHEFYETRRLRPPQPDVPWQWNYDDPQFTANFLGHILHLVDGMIMSIRTAPRIPTEGGTDDGTVVSS